jgi:glycosyltransferase involved in cell wall biosynthesis
MIRVLALVARPPGQAPSQRFRLEQWAPHLEARHGIRLDYHPFQSPELSAVLHLPRRRVDKARLLARDFWRRREVLALAQRYDAAVVQREAATIGPAVYERLLAWEQVPLVYDFDDAIFLPPAPTLNGVFARLHFAGKTSSICRIAGAVTVGNAYLAAWARERSDHVHVVPTSIELAKFAVQPPLPPDAPFTIVWTGSVSTLLHLEHARGPLEALARRRPVRLRVICSDPPARPFAGVEVEFVRWRAATEGEDLGPAHVGIMPLPDDAFARGKCGCKALQYMAVGRPVVLSPVGVNVDIVRSRENGLLASTDEEWVEALDELAADPALRDRLGAEGRRTVELGYSAEASAEKFARAVHDAIGR